MIVNAPTYEGLTDQAIRLHFSAWVSLVEIVADFHQHFGLDLTESKGEYEFEWSEYLAQCQSELQAIVTIIQQSNELALKARLCAVSPYLLLLKTDAKFSTSNTHVDFADLRTLDAIDLPGVVNSICDVPLSQKYIQMYSRARSMRNQIAHLGETSEKFLPEDLMHMLIAQYIELWHDRAWLQDRVKIAGGSRRSYFHDYKYASPEAEVMAELPYTFHLLKGAEFKGLFKQSRSKRRYLCRDCVYLATTKYTSFNPHFSKTAFLSTDGKYLECVMCGDRFEVLRIRCGHGNCAGDVVSEANADFADFCHTCGEEPVSGNTAAQS